MKIEIGQRFRYRPLGAESIWVVERLLQTPGAITHVTIKREGATRDTKTYSEAAFEDKASFERVTEAAE